MTSLPEDPNYFRDRLVSLADDWRSLAEPELAPHEVGLMTSLPDDPDYFGDLLAASADDRLSRAAPEPAAPAARPPAAHAERPPSPSPSLSAIDHRIEGLRSQAADRLSDARRRSPGARIALGDRARRLVAATMAPPAEPAMPSTATLLADPRPAPVVPEPARYEPVRHSPLAPEPYASDLFPSEPYASDPYTSEPSGASPEPAPERRQRFADPREMYKTIASVGGGMRTVGVLLLLFVAYQLWGTGVSEARSQRRLAGALDTALVPPGPETTPSAPAAPAADQAAGPSNGLARIEIPKIDVNKVVVNGVATADLRKGPGHFPGTPLPGEKGNVAIAGHRTTYGAPFMRLGSLEKGDEVRMTTPSGVFRYQVVEKRVVDPTDVGVVGATADNRLTLITCHPAYSARYRLVVVASLVGPAAPTAALAATDTQPAAETDGADLGGDPGAWPPTILWGAILVGVWQGARRAITKRSRLVTVGLFLPALLVAMVQLFGYVNNLLPSNI